MGIPEQSFRQIHLDFHTSEYIEGVGAGFDPDDFADTLKRAHVTSINCFAKCWHGWLYYDSKRFPEWVHPHLARRDLLPAQIEACHERGIRVPIYVGVQMANALAERRADWCQLRADGTLAGGNPLATRHRGPLCLNTGLADMLKELVRELFERMPAVDGFWFDGVNVQDCVCWNCRTEMHAKGIDPSDQAARRRFGWEVMNRWIADMSAFARGFDPQVTLFYNAGHLGPGYRPVADAFTHWEVESIPFQGWGFMHSPSVTRYVRTYGKDVVGMTGKFHTGWGDIHSYKTKAALEFECFQMLALGARCSVGDHLHPTGRIDPVTYELIGSVYEQVEAKEPWCRNARPLCDVAVLTPEALVSAHGTNEPTCIRGATRMLQELGVQFDIVDGESRLEGYRLLVLPDDVRVSPALAERIEAFVGNGGALLASGKSGVAEDRAGFALPALGIRRIGDAPFCPDYLVPEGPIGDGLPPVPHCMYSRAQQVDPEQGTEVLSQAERPYFNAAWPRYAGERSAGERVYPGVTRRGRAIYFAHPVFTIYHERSPLWVKTLVRNALDVLLPEPLLRHDGPSTLIATVSEQRAERRLIVHLLHYIPTRFGAGVDRIEDVIPLHDLRVSIRTQCPVSRVRLVPQGQVIGHGNSGGRIHFTVPCVVGHQIVEIGLAE
jgi:hypothetical protein